MKKIEEVAPGTSVEAVAGLEAVGEEEAEERHIVFAEVRGKEAEIEYDKWMFSTPKMLRKLKAVEATAAEAGEESNVDQTIETAEALVYIVEHVVVNWNVADKNGRIVPITTEAIDETIDLQSLLNIVQAIQEEVFPGEATGSGSQEA